MKRLFLVIISVLLMTGCSGSEHVPEVLEQDDGIVRILYYYADGAEMDSNIKAAVKVLQEYGKENNVKVEVTKYSTDELSYDDFELKRNTMIQNNEVDIVFDSADNLYEIKNKCGDYSRLDTYDSIWNNLKGYYCIPLFLYSHADKINNVDWELYDIASEKIKDVLTRQEYYEIKQQMKENGARFTLNKCEIMELVEYYIIKNNVRINETGGRYSVDENVLKQTITEIYEDIEKNYNVFDEEKIKKYETDYDIKDEVTGIVIRSWNVPKFRYMSNYEDIVDYVYNLESYENQKSSESSIFIDDIAVQVGRNFQYPSLFIRKNSADEVYKVVSILFTESYYKKISPPNLKSGYSPVIDTSEIREYINVDENWKYIGEIYDNGADKKGVEVFNRYYEIIRQEDISNIFTSRELREIIPDFIVEEIEKLIKNPEQEKNLDKDIDDFIVNLNIRHNS